MKQSEKPMNKVSKKTAARKRASDKDWFENNPPDENGEWTCYLQIHPDCPIKLTKKTLVLEHFYSKTRRPDLKYVTRNKKPACDPCNGMKLSKGGDEYGKKY